MNDVWQLENDQQLEALEDLDVICDYALSGKRKDQNYLKTLWPDCNWQTIKERLYTEGSCWYVWYMDGVNQHIQNIAETN